MTILIIKNYFEFLLRQLYLFKFLQKYSKKYIDII